MPDTTFTPGNTIHGFTVERVQEIPELLCTARIMRHVRTGARLIHLVKDDRNNLFCCGFRTPVYDSTGVPHILEHSVLGGSRKFPVKDPFQQLLKSSLQTFLNALTYPDKTLYPVGSQVESDFYNLVDVYCDAVFHPRLTEHTFYQEGWHFDVPDPTKPVDIKGIVYNEMKGVFSDFTSHVGRRALSGLYPDTTYFFESGGEPEHIPELTYESFKAFHSRYYHPSNAFIFLYGDNPTEKTLAFLEEQYLGAFDRIEIDSRVHRQPPWSEPRTMTIEAPAPPEDEGTASVDVCWLFGDSTDPVRSLAGTVLARYLIGAESSPLRRALIDSGLGEDLDVLCGFDNELVQSMFAAGLRKTRPEHAERIREIIFETLRAQAEGGIDEELLEGSLRQTEFALREISDAGRWPYSLKLADRCYRSWIYEGDPLAHLSFEQTLHTIRQGEGSVRAFFEKMLKETLIENSHHLLMTVKASPAMGKRLEKQTAEQAAKLTGSFTDDDVQRNHRLTLELMEEQKRRPSAEELATLPRVTKDDLPRHSVEVPTEIGTVGAAPMYAHPLFCGGITYLDIGFECADLPSELIPYLPMYCELATRCGAAAYTYEQMATRISLSTGGIGAGLLLDISVEDSATPLFKVFYHGKSLARRVGEMTGIMGELLTAPRLDDAKLIGDILREMRNDHNASIIGSGHSYAALRAASRLNAVRTINERLGGIEQLRILDRLVKDNDPAAVAQRMGAIHRHVITRGRAMISMTADDPSRHRAECEQLLAMLPDSGTAPAAAGAFEPAGGPSRTGIEISSSVNFVAEAWLLPHQSAAGRGTLSLLCSNLSRGFLWDRVRVEGGAYGSFASMGGTYPVFTCASYRDPNLARTLSAFDDALSYAAGEIDDSAVDESIVSTIGGIDKPKTPHARGYSETLALLQGRTREFRQEIRDAVLGATAQAVRAKASEILDSRDRAVAVLGSAGAFAQAAKEGLPLETEPLLGAR